MDIQIIKGHVFMDHVYLFVLMPPYHSASTVMKRIKGKIWRRLLLARRLWDHDLWVRGYFAASSGTVIDEVIARHIELQGEADRMGYQKTLLFLQ